MFVKIFALSVVIVTLPCLIGCESPRQREARPPDHQASSQNRLNATAPTRPNVPDTITYRLSQRRVRPVWDGTTWRYDDSDFRGERVEVEVSVVSVRYHKISKSMAAEFDEVVFQPKRAASVPGHPNCGQILMKYDRDAFDQDPFRTGQHWILILTTDAHLINLRAHDW